MNAQYGAQYWSRNIGTAIKRASNGNFAVTALTELAYQGAVSKNLFPLTEPMANQLNEKNRLAIVPEITNLLGAPTPFSANTTADSLGNDDAGRYALKLAALAHLGSSRADGLGHPPKHILISPCHRQTRRLIHLPADN